MDDSKDAPDTTVTMGRRALFGRVLLAVGASAGLLGLTGCPGGQQDDDGDDDGDDD